MNSSLAQNDDSVSSDDALFSDHSSAVHDPANLSTTKLQAHHNQSADDDDDKNANHTASTDPMDDDDDNVVYNRTKRANGTQPVNQNDDDDDDDDDSDSDDDDDADVDDEDVDDDDDGVSDDDDDDNDDDDNDDDDDDVQEKHSKQQRKRPSTKNDESDDSDTNGNQQSTNDDDDDDDDDDDAPQTSKIDSSKIAASQGMTSEELEEIRKALGLPKGASVQEILAGGVPDQEPRRSTRGRKPVVTVEYLDFDDSPPAKDSRSRGAQAGRGRKRVIDSDDDDDDDGSPIRKRRRVAPSARQSTRQRTSRKGRGGSDDDDLDPSSILDIRRSGRQVQRKTYADDKDATDSEEREVQEYRRQTKVEQEQEDLRSKRIEKILDHRLPDSWQDQEYSVEYFYEHTRFFVKWARRAIVHGSWHTYHELENERGFKTLQRYAGNLMPYILWLRESGTKEDWETYDMNAELRQQQCDEAKHAERVVSIRDTVPQYPGDDFVGKEYLVKWTSLDYKECTWERDPTGLEAPIQAYHKRLLGDHIRTPLKADIINQVKVPDAPDYIPFQLRDYQVEGVKWLVHQYQQNINTILADEMGLGKTIQTISFQYSLHQLMGVSGPHLVIAPLSTLSSWMREFAKWAPQFNVVMYTGDAEGRQIVRQFEWIYRTSRKPSETLNPAFNVLLTSYEIVLKDRSHLQEVYWTSVSIDEAHRLKNNDSELYKCLFAFQTDCRFLITGTPLQNSIKELWCLLHFLEPDKFDSCQEFEKQYKELNSHDDVLRLHNTLKPHLLRRIKQDVETSLPPKIERILRVELSESQRNLYKLILTRNFKELSKGGKAHVPSLTNIVMELKKVCNHPFLFEGIEVPQESKQKSLENMIVCSGKLLLLDKLLIRLKNEGHRVLIFSQMVRVLDILADYLLGRSFAFQRLDGSTSSIMRQRAMEHYNAPESKDFCFLLSTRAGGLGINLTGADTVIIFDSDWNPQNDLQAEARAHRIGQKKTVNIYRLVCKDTVEEKILERAKQKMVLDQVVIQSMDAGASFDRKTQTIFSKQDLGEILKFGAESLFKENAQEGGGNEDIDDILARAELECDKPKTAGQAFLDMFRVATLTKLDFHKPELDQTTDEATTTTEPKVDTEIESFWSTIIPAQDIQAIESEELAKTLEDPGQRKRQRTQHFLAEVFDDPLPKPKKKKTTAAKRAKQVDKEPKEKKKTKNGKDGKITDKPGKEKVKKEKKDKEKKNTKDDDNKDKKGNKEKKEKNPPKEKKSDIKLTGNQDNGTNDKPKKSKKKAETADYDSPPKPKKEKKVKKEEKTAWDDEQHTTTSTSNTSLKTAVTASTSPTQTNEKYSKKTPTSPKPDPAAKIISKRECKPLVEALKRYGDLPHNFDKLIAEAGLTSKDPQWLQDRISDFVEACRKANTKGHTSQTPFSHLPPIPLASTIPATPTTTLVTTNSNSGPSDANQTTLNLLLQACRPKDIVDRVSWMAHIGLLLEPFNGRHRLFRLRIPFKPWKIIPDWSEQDDAMLLVGIWRHGFGGWEAVIADEELQLGPKILYDKELQVTTPKPHQLLARVQHLLSQQHEGRGKRSAPTTTPAPTAASSTTATTAANKRRAASSQDRDRDRNRDRDRHHDERDSNHIHSDRHGSDRRSNHSSFSHTYTTKQADQNQCKDLMQQHQGLISSFTSKMPTLPHPEKRELTRQFILDIGRAIQSLLGQHHEYEPVTLERDLWLLVQEQTTLKGKLSDLYQKLTAQT